MVVPFLALDGPPVDGQIYHKSILCYLPEILLSRFTKVGIAHRPVAWQAGPALH